MSDGEATESGCSLMDEVERLKRNERTLLSRVAHLLRQLRGPKSEAMDPAQLLLFALPEMASALQIEPETEGDASQAKPRRRRRGATRPLLREREVHEVPGEERRCACCGDLMDVIREEITEPYDYRQAAVFIREHVRPVYACTKGCATRPVIARKPAQPIEKGLPGPGRLEPDNGRSERALKLVAINRRNWLLARSENGGRWAATIWSLVSTCRLHRLDPEAYLRDLLRALPSSPHRLVSDWTPLAWARRSAPPQRTS